MKEVLKNFSGIKDGLIVDATLGRGGHSIEILSKFNKI